MYLNTNLFLVDVLFVAIGISPVIYPEIVPLVKGAGVKVTVARFRISEFLRLEFRDYTSADLYKDLLAALAVALMTVPQSLAYSLLAGLPPTAGLYSAIVGTFFAGCIGSSRYLIGGASTGTAILLQTAIASILYTYYPEAHGTEKQALILQILLQMLLVVGCLQIFLALINVSKLLQFVSRSVILGYFSGIACVIGISQLFFLSGITPLKGEQPLLFKAWYFFSHIYELQWPTFVCGGISLVLLLLLRRFFPNLPSPLIVLGIAIGIAAWLNVHFPKLPIPTLSSLHLPEEMMPHWRVPFLDLGLLPKIFPAALALSFLAILEVFSVSRSFASKSGQKICTNQDILGLGVSNFILSFIHGAMISSGSATRTSFNYRMQAKTRIASITSAVFTAGIVLIFWPWVGKIPLAALAALLIAAVHVLMDFKEIRFTFRATKEDAAVFLLTFFSCLLLNLEIAFFLGIVISIASYLRRSATPILVEYAFNAKGRLMTVSPNQYPKRQIRIIGIGGDLYFASADVFQEAIESIAQDTYVQAIVLRLNNVHHVDASMCLAVLRLYQTLKNRGCYFFISGMTEEVWQVFYRAGLVSEIGRDHLYFREEENPQYSTWKACARAQEFLYNKGK